MISIVLVLVVGVVLYISNEKNKADKAINAIDISDLEKVNTSIKENTIKDAQLQQTIDSVVSKNLPALSSADTVIKDMIQRIDQSMTARLDEQQNRFSSYVSRIDDLSGVLNDIQSYEDTVNMQIDTLDGSVGALAQRISLIQDGEIGKLQRDANEWQNTTHANIAGLQKNFHSFSNNGLNLTVELEGALKATQLSFTACNLSNNNDIAVLGSNIGILNNTYSELDKGMAIRLETVETHLQKLEGEYASFSNAYYDPSGSNLVEALGSLQLRNGAMLDGLNNRFQKLQRM